MATETIEAPVSTTDTTNLLGTPRNVVLFNDEDHDMMEVCVQIKKAIKCDNAKAVAIMTEAHTTGRAIVFTGPLEKCEHVEAILAEINLGTKIE